MEDATSGSFSRPKRRMEDTTSGSFSRPKRRMEDATSGSFSRPKRSLSDEHEAASTLVQMKRQSIDSITANHLNELIAKNKQASVRPKVRPLFPFRHLVKQYSTCLVKELTTSDIKSNQMRLMFPKAFVEEGINALLKDDESPKRGIPVTVYFMDTRKNSKVDEYEMIYKSWVEDKTYVLTSSGWLDFVVKSEMKQGDEIKLWAFRHPNTGNLNFIITPGDHV